MTPVHAFDLSASQPSFSASLETWLYGSASDLKSNSILNPDNLIAKLPTRKGVLDGRLDIRGEAGPFDLFVAPRLLDEINEIDGDRHSYSGALRLNQGFMRSKIGGDTFLAGRERLTWGPANFRSPSNPYYFDSGRTNPLSLTPGIDLIRYTYGTSAWRLTGAYVASTKEVASAGPSRQSAFFKLDYQGDSHLISLIAAKPIETNAASNMSPFIGAFGQFSPDDAWLIYGELSSARQSIAILPVGDSATPPVLLRSAPRTEQFLIGASYTQENGNVVLAEYLRNGAGFSQSDERRYFAQAMAAGRMVRANSPVGYETLGQLLQYQPSLMSRDYLWLGWQSNPQSTSLMWRAELAINTNDHSAQSLLYAEKPLFPRLSGFVAINNNIGSTHSEYGALSKGQLTLGFKWFGL